MRSMELFAGGGGLLLGTHLGGFSTEFVAEWDHWCCDTLRNNQAQGYPLLDGAKIQEGDVRDIDWEPFQDQIDVLSAGPPCQPFSGGGKAMAHGDSRDMFPVTADVIRQVRPRAFIVENVRGLTRSRFSDYFNYIQLRLSHPEMSPRAAGEWTNHYSQLQSEHESGSSDLQYSVVPTLVNTADYGVPQQRWRVFLVGFRSDQDVSWSFPQPTHSQAALQQIQTSGEYWDRHGLRRPSDKEGVIPLVRDQSAHPWRTVRDALVGLPEPNSCGSDDFLNHVLQPGARSYPGHTGSLLDEPAKTLKAGVHGVPGGENMMRYEDGSVRYFTVREAARLQTFPDRYALHGPWSEAMRQLGNAVPVLMAHIVAAAVREHLVLADLKKQIGSRTFEPEQMVAM